MKKKCVICGKEYVAIKCNIKTQKYCSLQCRRIASSANSNLSFLPPSTVGAIGELIASADLMKKGYEVFRSLSPACSCDILAKKNEEFFSFEVRTGYRYSNTKKISYSNKHIKAKNLVIIIHNTNEVIYIPEKFIVN